MVYILIMLSLFLTDSLIKYKIEKDNRPGETKQIWNGRVRIKKYHNTGAMFNMGAARQPLIALVSLVFAVFMAGIFFASLGMRGKRLLKTGLALLLGGAFSNTYDRLRRRYVVDYFSFRLGKSNVKFGRTVIKWFEGIVFNLSDFGILIGAAILVLFHFVS